MEGLRHIEVKVTYIELQWFMELTIREEFFYLIIKDKL